MRMYNPIISVVTTYGVELVSWCFTCEAKRNF